MEENIIKDAEGIDEKTKNQIEAVAILMDSVTHRMELSTKRTDSAAKWFGILVTFIASVSTAIITTQSSQRIADKNATIILQENELKRVADRLEKVEKKNASLDRQLKDISIVLKNTERDNEKIYYELLDILSKDRSKFE